MLENSFSNPHNKSYQCSIRILWLQPATPSRISSRSKTLLPQPANYPQLPSSSSYPQLPWSASYSQLLSAGTWGTVFHHHILAVFCLFLSITPSNIPIPTSVCFTTPATAPFTFSTATSVSPSSPSLPYLPTPLPAPQNPPYCSSRAKVLDRQLTTSGSATIVERGLWEQLSINLIQQYAGGSWAKWRWRSLKVPGHLIAYGSIDVLDPKIK